MSANDKANNGIEAQILKEFREEMRELKRQGKLYKFETAMDHAMEKFRNEVNKMAEQEVDDYSKEGSVKKNLSEMR